MIIYLLLILLFIVLVGFHISIRYSRAGRMLSKIPGPLPVPVFGNAHLFSDTSQRGVWVTLRSLSDHYYPISKVYLFHQAIVSIRCPEDFEALLTSTKSNYKEYPYYYLRPWLQNGIFLIKGDNHKIRRKILTPVFHFNMLKGYVDIMNEQTNLFINELREKGAESVMDIFDLFTKASLNIIVETAMGVNLRKAGKEYANTYQQALEEMGYILVYRMFRPYLSDFMFNLLTKVGRKQKQVLKIFQDMTNEIIQERKKYLENSGCRLQGFTEITKNMKKENPESIYNIDHKKKLPMLDLLLAMQRDGLIDDDGVREEVNTFIFGGTDTVRICLAYFTMMMAENEDVQDRARAEVCEVLDESGGKTGTAELQRLTYLERCIKEVLRLYPVAPTVFRYTVDDVPLSDYVVPAGVTVVCNVFDVHRDPDFWTDPDRYDPDRFLPENSRNRHPFSYLPFLAGMRNCIGQKFAMMELKTICARLLYNFKLEPVDLSADMKLVADIVLRPLDPFRTKFVRIDR